MQTRICLLYDYRGRFGILIIVTPSKAVRPATVLFNLILFNLCCSAVAGLESKTPTVADFSVVVRLFRVRTAASFEHMVRHTHARECRSCTYTYTLTHSLTATHTHTHTHTRMHTRTHIHSHSLSLARFESHRHLRTATHRQSYNKLWKV